MEQSLRTVAQAPALALWSERVRECRESGQKVSQWCAEHEISVSTYYKWQRKLFAMVQQEQPRFAEITPAKITSGPAAVTVRFAGAEIDIQNGADEETVGMVLRLLRSC